MSEPYMYNRTQLASLVEPLEQQIKELESKLRTVTERYETMERLSLAFHQERDEALRRLDTADKLLADIKRDLLDRGRYDPVLGGKVVDLSSTLFNRLCIFLECAVEKLCPNCGGSGQIEVHRTRADPGCCGNTLRTGECCGNAVPMPVEYVDIEPCPCVSDRQDS